MKPPEPWPREPRPGEVPARLVTPSGPWSLEMTNAGFGQLLAQLRNLSLQGVLPKDSFLSDLLETMEGTVGLLTGTPLEKR